MALDDYFNEDWPDVSTGAARYFDESDTRLRPFAIAPNKVFLTTAGFNAFYRGKLSDEAGFRRHKTSTMFNSEVDVFHGTGAAPPIQDYLRESLRGSAIGPYLLAAKRALKPQR